MLTNVLGTMYLTMTFCTGTGADIQCKDINIKQPEATFFSCLQQGMFSGMKNLEWMGKKWKLKKWRCSGKPPLLGV